MNVIKIIIFSFLFSFYSIAGDIQSGDLIKLKNHKGRVFSLGSIQQSILSEEEFQNLSGNCWIQLNPSSGTSVDISGSDLSSLTSKSSLPNIKDTFLSNSGGNSGSVGTIQNETVKKHRHWISNGPFDDGNATGNMTNTQRYGLWGDAGSYSVNDHNSSIGRYSAYHNKDGETRPKNLSVNIFIKINRNCN